MYYVFLKNYDSLHAVKTNKYHEGVKDSLFWYYGDNYSIVLVLENPKIILTSYIIEEKDEILDELEWKEKSFYFDEEGEELKLKINLFKSILA